MHLGLSCLLECLCNLTMSVVYVITAVSSSSSSSSETGWVLGLVACQVNSFFMEVVPVVYTLLLLNLVIDR